MKPIRTVIMGAAGRDFHNFNTVYRDNPRYDVVAFTATQIPNIDGRKYPASLAGKLYPKGIPILAESDLEQIIRDAQGPGSRLCVQRRDLQLRDGPRVHRQRRRGRLQDPRGRDDDAEEQEAGHLHLRRPHGLRQEPDDAPDRGNPPRGGPEGGRRAPPDALRQPREAARPAVRLDCRPQEARLHHRGDRGVRAAHRQRHDHLRRRGLRRHPGPGAGGSGRRLVGRRQQRHAVLQARSAHRRGGPPARRKRAAVPPQRDEPAARGCRHHQQGGHRRHQRHQRAAGQHPAGQRPGRHHRGRVADHRHQSRATSPASGCSSSRTARRSRTAR